VVYPNSDDFRKIILIVCDYICVYNNISYLSKALRHGQEEYHSAADAAANTYIEKRFKLKQCHALVNK